MASLDEESLPTLINNLQSQLVSSQRQLSIVRAQIQGRAREAKMQELTLEQLRDLGPSTRVYKAVGKMFLQQSFEEMMADVQSRRTEVLEENDMLDKKRKFLEKESSGAQTHLTDIVRSIERHNST